MGRIAVTVALVDGTLGPPGALDLDRLADIGMGTGPDAERVGF